MSVEMIQKIIDGRYDDSKEDTLVSWLRDAYSKRMLWVMINVYMAYLILSVLVVFSGIKFFTTEQVQYQIMYAALFVCGNLWIGFVSVFGWVMLQRPRILREIKRLELRIAALGDTSKSA